MRKSKLYLTFAAVLALMAAVPAASSADQFHWSTTGSYASYPLENPVFTLEGETEPSGILKCTKAAGSGALTYTDFSFFDLTVQYSNCALFEFIVWKPLEVTYRYHADGQLDLLTPLTHTLSPFDWCTLTIPAQKDLGTVHYANNYNKMKIDHEIEGISYSLKGPSQFGCAAASRTDGTLDGLTEMGMVGGGSVNWEEW